MNNHQTDRQKMYTIGLAGDQGTGKSALIQRVRWKLLLHPRWTDDRFSLSSTCSWSPTIGPWTIIAESK